MKKTIFATIILVLVLAGCSRPELGPTDPTAPNGPANTMQSDDSVTFDRTDNSLYTPSGEFLLNLTWFGDVGKTNAAVTLAKTAVTSEDSFTAYVIGEESEVQSFFLNVQELIGYYKDDSKNEERASGGFELYGEWWKIGDLEIEDLKVEMEQVDYYYIFRFDKDQMALKVDGLVTPKGAAGLSFLTYSTYLYEFNVIIEWLKQNIWYGITQSRKITNL